MDEIKLTQHDFLIASDYYESKVNQTYDSTLDKKICVVVNKLLPQSNTTYYELLGKFLDVAQEKGYIDAWWNANMKIVPCGFYLETTFVVNKEVEILYPHMHEKLVKIMDFFITEAVITSWDIQLNNL